MTEFALPEEDRALAAEYALRLLDGGEARQAAARAMTDRAFADEVRFWDEKMARLADDIVPVSPRTRVQRQLWSRVFGENTRDRWWTNFFWQGLAMASMAASIVLAVLLLTIPDVEEPTLFLAELQGTDALAVTAVVNATAHQIKLTLDGDAPATGRDRQLWGIPEGGTPVPIGILPETGTATLLVPEALFGRAQGLTLAISDEPDGGSPTGQPTGDILAAALLTEL